MSIVLQFVDFTASGVLGAAWTATGGTFTQDGQRAYPTTPATYSRATLVAAPALSASSPIKGRYEVDFLLPAAFPASGVVRLGVVFAGGAGHLVWTRSSGGGSTLMDFFVRHGTTGVETSFFSATTALAAGSTVRLRADVTYNSANVVVEASYSTNGGQSFNSLFMSSPSTAAWNTAAGTAFATMTAAPRNGGIVANVAGSPGFLDNFRVTDIGSLAAQPSITTAPTLTPYPTLSPITVDAEDDATVATLSVDPDFPLRWSDGYRVTEHPYDGGYVAAVRYQTAPRRTVPFVWSNRSGTDKDAVVSLFSTVGQHSTFSWSDPTTGATLRLRFISTLTTARVGPDAYDVSAEVREVFAGA